MQRFGRCTDPRTSACETGILARASDNRLGIPIRPQTRVEIEDADVRSAAETRCDYLFQDPSRPTRLATAVEKAFGMRPLTARYRLLVGSDIVTLDPGCDSGTAFGL